MNTNPNKNTPHHTRSGERLRFSDQAKGYAKNIAVVAITSVATIGVTSLDGPERPDKPIPTQTEIATPDDTLWEMTDKVKNVHDKRDVIDWVQDNSPDLADNVTNSGDEIVLPLDAQDIK